MDLPPYRYCAMCQSGNEALCARLVEACCECRVLIPESERAWRKQGEWSVRRAPLLGGYLFFYAETPLVLRQLYAIDRVYRLLRYEEREFCLRGADDAFSAWLWRYGGCVPLSTVARDGARVRVVDGPLKDCAGEIVYVKNQHRSALVSVALGGDVRRIWLSFDWLGDADGRRERMISAEGEEKSC